jgi:WD40 repeat protein
MNLSDNLIIKRRINISKVIDIFFPKDISKLISEYDYHLQGISCIFKHGFEQMHEIENIFVVKRSAYAINKEQLIVGINSGSDDYHLLTVWNLSNDKCDNKFQDPTCFYDAAVLPDGRIVSQSGYNSLKIWSTQTGKCDIIIETKHAFSVVSITVLSDGRIVTGSFDSTLKIFNSSSGNCDITLLGHNKSVQCVATLNNYPDPSGCCFGERVERIVSGSFDSTIKIWNSKTGVCDFTFYEHSGAVYCIAVLSDGRIISGSKDRTLKICNLQTGECNVTLKGHSDSVLCVAELPDGRVVSGSLDNTIKVWNVHTGKCDHTFTGHYDAVRRIVVLNDGRIISALDDNTIRIWS